MDENTSRPQPAGTDPGRTPAASVVRVEPATGPCRTLVTPTGSLVCAAHPVRRPAPWNQPTGCAVGVAQLCHVCAARVVAAHSAYAWGLLCRRCSAICVADAAARGTRPLTDRVRVRGGVAVDPGAMRRSRAHADAHLAELREGPARLASSVVLDVARAGVVVDDHGRPVELEDPGVCLPWPDWERVVGPTPEQAVDRYLAWRAAVDGPASSTDRAELVAAAVAAEDTVEPTVTVLRPRPTPEVGGPPSRFDGTLADVDVNAPGVLDGRYRAPDRRIAVTVGGVGTPVAPRLVPVSHVDLLVDLASGCDALQPGPLEEPDLVGQAVSAAFWLVLDDATARTPLYGQGPRRALVGAALTTVWRMLGEIGPGEHVQHLKVPRVTPRTERGEA